MKKTLTIFLTVVLCMTLFAGSVIGEATINYDIDAIAGNITAAYGGDTDQGEYVGFGVNEDGSFAIIFFFTPEEHVTFVGSAVVEDGIVSIEDSVNGLTIGFEIVEASEEGVILDFGDQGTGTLEAMPVENLVEALTQVITNTFTVESVVGGEAAEEVEEAEEEVEEE